MSKSTMATICRHNLRYCTQFMKNLSARQTRSVVSLASASYFPAQSEINGGPPLLVMHGLFGSKNNWQILSKRLAEMLRLQVLSVDLRNHGDSGHSSEMNYRVMAEDVTAFLDELNVDCAHILAHSMGGRVAMFLAMLQPERVKSLTVVDVIPDRSAPNSKQYVDYVKAMMDVNLTVIDNNLPNLRRRVMQELSAVIPDLAIRGFLVQQLVIDSEQPDRGRWKFNLPSIQQNWQLLREFQLSSVKTQPFKFATCFIGGAKSPYLPDGRYTESEEKLIFEYFPSAKLYVIENAGHWVHADQPQSFLQTVETFMSSLR